MCAVQVSGEQGPGLLYACVRFVVRVMPGIHVRLRSDTQDDSLVRAGEPEGVMWFECARVTLGSGVWRAVKLAIVNTLHSCLR